MESIIQQEDISVESEIIDFNGTEKKKNPKKK
mgnify:CR=1 FL=1